MLCLNFNILIPNTYLFSNHNHVEPIALNDIQFMNVDADDVIHKQGQNVSVYT